MLIHFSKGYPEMMISPNGDLVLFSKMQNFLLKGLNATFINKIQHGGDIIFWLFEYCGVILVLMNEPDMGISICPTGFVDYTSEDDKAINQLAKILENASQLEDLNLSSPLA